MAVGDTHVFPGFLTPERKFASTGDRTHNHQVLSPTHSPLSHPGGVQSMILDNTHINLCTLKDFADVNLMVFQMGGVRLRKGRYSLWSQKVESTTLSVPKRFAVSSDQDKTEKPLVNTFPTF